MPEPVDPVALTADLVRCPSVTPDEGGALVLLQTLLSDAGFACTRVDRGETSNLMRAGATRRTRGLSGSTVIPTSCRPVTLPTGR